RILREKKWDVELEQLLQLAYEQYDNIDSETDEKVRTFFKNRATYLLEEYEVTHDIIDAVLAQKIGAINYTIAKAQLLSDKRNDSSFKKTEEALIRVLNLNKQALDQDVDQTLLETDAEKALYDTYNEVEEAFKQYDDARD